MLWKSIIGGLAILGHWQVWVAIVIYLIIIAAFQIITGIMEFGERKSEGAINISVRLTGCIFGTIGGVLLQGILMGLLIAFLFPILLGGSSVTPIASVMSIFWLLIKVGIITIVFVTLICFIPIIGRFIAESPGILGFIEGVIIFRILSVFILDNNFSIVNISVGYPGFWLSIVFLLIAGILVRMLMYIFILLSIPFQNTWAEDWFSSVIAPVLGLLGGLVPLFMYASYVRLSLPFQP